MNRVPALQPYIGRRSAKQVAGRITNTIQELGPCDRATLNRNEGLASPDLDAEEARYDTGRGLAYLRGEGMAYFEGGRWRLSPELRDPLAAADDWLCPWCGKLEGECSCDG